ncbi:MAG TPA: hypothetical protein VFB22_02010 [Candidatus Baltobacteraceae bacterium]|nr:hypothetical protein [Candidatus Baltobacteraceae bacterium]
MTKLVPAALMTLALLWRGVPAGAERPPVTKSASITLHLHAGADAAFPLFDPVNETKWDPDWKPRFLGDAIGEGLAFVVADGDRRSTWLIDRYDARARTIAYVVFAPSTLTRIHIDVLPDGDRSIATVTYTRTALDDAGVEAVEHFVAQFPAQAPHWESAINGYLDSTRR